MLIRIVPFCLVVATVLAARSDSAGGYVPGQAAPPLPLREFRGAWVATVNNIDWPSKPGLPVSQQKAELLALFDLAVQLRLNAIIFQVRPGCDALYSSRLEPWSEYLTGEMGRAPSPAYDPLRFAVDEAHRRGLELHAWFNPFRARHSSAKSAISRDHLSRTRPELVLSYGKQLWLDPGQKAVQDHSLKVILDVVERYDVDGVHMDDYFYPYREQDASKKEIEFPDDASWRRYVQNGGKLDRSEWRRENVNTFVRRLYGETKRAKPWVKVGISPFGIWRPGYPAQIRGLDAFEKLHADSRRWLANGWLDYVAPQLYWAINAPQQSFPVLLQWWREQNPQRRHVWPGISVYRASAQPSELASEIRLTREGTQSPGNLLWSMKPLQQNKGNAATELRQALYLQPALPPAYPWLDNQTPGKPALTASRSAGVLKIAWQPAGSDPIRFWVVQRQDGKSWTTDILPGSQTSCRLSAKQGWPTAVAVRAVDRCGNPSPPAVLQANKMVLEGL